MSEGQKAEEILANQESTVNTGKSGVFGKINGKKWGIVGGIATVLIAIIVCISIYNTSAYRLPRLLDLGNRYLEEQNYEQALIAFDKAIAIDDRCMEAYAGGIKSYQGLGDKEGLINLYEDALEMTAGLEKTELAESMEAVVYIYLVVDEVYSNDRVKVIEILKEGLIRTEDGQIKEKLEEDYLGLANEYVGKGDYEKAAEALEGGLTSTEDERIKELLIKDYLELAKEYADEGNYERALDIYDRLIELDAENDEALSNLEKCLHEYLALLMEQERDDKIEELEKKYLDEVNIEDIQTASDSVEEQAEAGEDSSWIDDLYQKMISGDIEAVYAIILAPDFMEKCSEYAYEYQEINNYTIGLQYGLLTSEGKTIVINEFSPVVGVRSVYAFYCVHEDEPRIGFVSKTVSGGDYYYSNTSPEEFNGRSWLIENAYYRDVLNKGGTLQYGELFTNLFSEGVGG